MIPQAHIRTATHQEIPGLFRPKVCVFRDEMHYRFDASTYEIIDVRENRIVAPEHREFVRIYTFSDGTVMQVEQMSLRWAFNGEVMEERWPTPQRRQLFAGPYVLNVRPEDDALFFAASGDRPAIDFALFGFFAATPPPRGSDIWPG